jgi:CheY-like chemotaxis protein
MSETRGTVDYQPAPPVPPRVSASSGKSKSKRVPPIPKQVAGPRRNPDCALSLASLLRLCGHQRVQVVSDGATALTVAQTGGIDVVLLDIGLPLLNGWDVARRIPAMPLLKRPIIVAITGYGQDADRQRSAEQPDESDSFLVLERE